MSRIERHNEPQQDLLMERRRQAGVAYQREARKARPDYDKLKRAAAEVVSANTALGERSREARNHADH